MDFQLVDEDTVLIIRDSNILVGSIKRVRDIWRVEMPRLDGSDVLHEAPSLAAAKLFVRSITESTT
jgi:hypothetical protein